jgi:hypothetical protein
MSSKYMRRYSTSSHTGNANQYYPEIPSHPSEIVEHQDIKQELLVLGGREAALRLSLGTYISVPWGSV